MLTSDYDNTFMVGHFQV